MTPTNVQTGSRERIPQPTSDMQMQWRGEPYLMLLLLVAGLLHWFIFLGAGEIPIVTYDWAKENAYMNILRVAMEEGVLPWSWEKPEFHATDKILAIPEISLTPDLFLLRWFPNRVFILLHVLSLYAVGFWGIYRWAKRLKIGPLPFTFFWLLFSFNGHITSHITAGHFQWTGYFLLPLFFLYLYQFAQDAQHSTQLNRPKIMYTALIIGFLMWNGSFHIAIWCSMFATLALPFRWKMIGNITAGLGLGYLIGVGRIIPAMLFLDTKDYLLSGYPSADYLYRAIVVLQQHTEPYWWEFSMFIGPAACLLMITGSLITARTHNLRTAAPLIAAALIILPLTWQDVYAPIANLPIPFASVERAPMRFIIMPFFILALGSTVGVQWLMQTKSWLAKLMAGAAIAATGYDLWQHSQNWRLVRAMEIFEHRLNETYYIPFVPATDSLYIYVVYASWAVSLVATIIIIVAAITAQRNARQAQTSQAS